MNRPGFYHDSVIDLMDEVADANHVRELQQYIEHLESKTDAWLLWKALKRASAVAHCMETMHFENGEPMSPQAQLAMASNLAAEIDESLASIPEPKRKS